MPARQVLSHGRIVFLGPREDVVPFFSRLGLQVPPTKTVPDFLQVSVDAFAFAWRMEDRWRMDDSPPPTTCPLCTFTCKLSPVHGVHFSQRRHSRQAQSSNPSLERRR